MKFLKLASTGIDGLSQRRLVVILVLGAQLVQCLCFRAVYSYLSAFKCNTVRSLRYGMRRRHSVSELGRGGPHLSAKNWLLLATMMQGIMDNGRIDAKHDSTVLTDMPLHILPIQSLHACMHACTRQEVPPPFPCEGRQRDSFALHDS